MNGTREPYVPPPVPVSVAFASSSTTITLPKSWPKHRGYVLEANRGTTDTLTVTVRYVPKPKRTTRMKFRMRRFVRTVKAAAFEAAARHLGRPCTREIAGEVSTDVINAMRETATRYAHLKA